LDSVGQKSKRTSLQKESLDTRTVNNDRIVLVDGNYLAYFIRHSNLMNLSYSSAQTGVIFGFLRHLLVLATSLNTTKIAIAFDSKRSVRKMVYKEYKATRSYYKTDLDKEIDRMMWEQVEDLQDLLPSIGFVDVYKVPGYEADDIAGVFALRKLDNGAELVIVSEDSDLFQLLKEDVSLYSLRKKSFFRKGDFEKKYDIEPKYWDMVKAIGGCSVDNVKGIEGIGEKRAIAYLNGKLVGSMKERIKKSQDIINRNINLVKLPHVGIVDHITTIPTDEVKEVRLEVGEFENLCKTLGFYTFLKDDNYSRWIRVFG
jgi:DNA polymerase I